MKKKLLSIMLAVVMIVGVIPFGVLTAAAENATETFSLGKFDTNTLTFPNAAGTGTKTYKSLLLAYGNATSSGERMVLPAVSGFVKNDTASANYSAVIDMSSGKTLAEIADYVKRIVFQNSPAGQSLQVSISPDGTTNKTFYNEANGHYYQYVRYPDNGCHHWIDAYNAAKDMTYAGRKGYLATITDFNEDLFIYNASDSVGFLGGTVLGHGAEDGDLYYIFTSEHSAAYNKDTMQTWYWACGPERGQTFFEGRGSNNNYTENTQKGYYFNWSTYGGFYEPNSWASIECCLSSLRTGVGYGAKQAGSNVESSWNDVREDCYGTASEPHRVCGYFVEYGDQIIGDSGKSTDNDSITANAAIGYTIPNNTASLTIEADIVTNFKLDLDTYAANEAVNVSDLTVKATYNANSNKNYEDGRQTVDVTAELEKIDGRYVFRVAQAPAQIAEPITVEIYNEETLLDTIECGGKYYADRFMEKTAEDLGISPETLDELKAFCVAMVNYGDCAQKFFGCGETVITAEDGDIYDCILPEQVKNAVFAVNGSDIKVKSLTFMSLADSALRIYYDGDITAADVNGGTVNTEKKYIEVSGIIAADLDEVFTVTVKGTTIEANALAYAYLGIGSSDTVLRDLCKSIALYNTAANTAFDK